MRAIDRCSYLYATAALLLASCFAPRVPVGLRCGPNGECPGEQPCVVNAEGIGICQGEPGLGLDAGCVLNMEGECPLVGEFLPFEFSAGVDYSLGASFAETFQFDSGDVTGDGVIDLVAFTSSELSGKVPPEATLQVWQGQGDGTFTLLLTPPSVERGLGLVVGQIDGIGAEDFAFVHLRATSPPDPVGEVIYEVYLHDTSAPGSFVTSEFSGSSELADRGTLHLADVSNDGKPDLVLSFDQQLEVLAQGADASFTLLPGPLATGFGEQVEFHDLNDDSLVDIISRGEEGLRLQFQSSASPGTFEAPSNLAATQQPYGVVDIDGDLKNDIFTAFRTYLQDPDIPGTYSSLDVNCCAGDGFDSGDFNGDGDVDVVNDNGQISAELRVSGSVNGQLELLVDRDRNPRDVTVGDFNGDAKDDIAILHLGDFQQSGFLRVFLQQ